MKENGPIRVLMVCWGNICRSPTAEGIMRSMVAKKGLPIEVDSAGTSDEHQGDPPHHRAIAEARRRGIDLSGLRARQIHVSDFAEFDLILTADQMVDRLVRRQAGPGSRARVMRMTELGPDFDRYPDVPDPYYGTESDYEFVFELLERACLALVESIASGDVEGVLSRGPHPGTFVEDE